MTLYDYYFVNWNLKWRIRRRIPNSPLPTRGSLFWGVNCLVVFPIHFKPNNSLLISLQISLLFRCTPALTSKEQKKVKIYVGRSSRTVHNVLFCTNSLSISYVTWSKFLGQKQTTIVFCPRPKKGKKIVIGYLRYSHLNSSLLNVFYSF